MPEGEIVLEGRTYCYKSKQNACPAPTELEGVIQNFQLYAATSGVVKECNTKHKGDDTPY